MAPLTGLLLGLFHREEGQEGDEGPVHPPQPSREKQRSHSKSKKTRREHRHAERGAETAAPGLPSTAALPPRTVEERQVTANERRKRVDGRVSLSSPVPRPPSPWRAPPQSQAQTLLQALPSSGAPSSGTAGHCTTTRRCPKDGPANSSRGSPVGRPGSSTST